MRELIPLTLGPDKQAEIAGYLQEKLQLTITARQSQVDGKFRRWQDNYAAKPMEAERTTPFIGASNFVPQLIRMHCDILSARLVGILFSAKPFWKPRSFIGQIPHEMLESLSEWLEYQSFTEIGLFDPIDRVVNLAVKNGTIVFKAPWVDEVFFNMSIDGNAVREVPERSEGLQLAPIAFDDFWPYPITSPTLKTSLIKFHRLRCAKEEVQYRIDSALWYPKAADLLLTGGGANKGETKRESEATQAGISVVPDISRPYDAFEAWLDYPLAPGKLYPIVVVFNPQIQGADSILRHYYSPYSRRLDPFVDIHLMPRDNLFYDYCVPEILEQAQEEQAQIHNSRRDANQIANVPGWKKRRYGDVPNPSSNWYPGKVFELDDLGDLEPLQFGVKYTDMIEEESFLLQLAERYTGIGPPMQGTGAGMMDGKRGIYNAMGTLQMISEGNRRLDIYVRRLRDPFHKFGTLIYQSHRDFAPDANQYQAYGENGILIQKSFSFKEPAGFRGYFFDVSASDAGANKEIDRSSLLLMANTMASYYRQVVECSSIISQIPDPRHPMYQILVEVLTGARDLANRLLFYYDIGDRKRLLPDVREILSGGAGAGPGAGTENIPAAGPQELVSDEGLRALSGHLAALTGGGALEGGGSRQPS